MEKKFTWPRWPPDRLAERWISVADRWEIDGIRECTSGLICKEGTANVDETKISWGCCGYHFRRSN
jgi:hypothetical protein